MALKKKKNTCSLTLSLMFHHCRWTDTRHCWYSEEGSWLKSITVYVTWRAYTALSWSKPEMSCSSTSLLTKPVVILDLVLFFFFPSQLGSTYFHKWKHLPLEIYKLSILAYFFTRAVTITFIIKWNLNVFEFSYVSFNGWKRYFWQPLFQ